MLWVTQLLILKRGFSVKRQSLETSAFQKVLYTSRGENLVFTGTLSPEDVCWQQADMWFHVRGFPRRDYRDKTQQRRNPQLCMRECVHAYARVSVRADQSANLISLSKGSSVIQFAKWAPVWLRQCCKDPLQALLKSFGNHLKRQQCLAQLYSG